LRHLVENAFLHLKCWRSTATRCAKNAASFPAVAPMHRHLDESPVTAPSSHAALAAESMPMCRNVLDTHHIGRFPDTLRPFQQITHSQMGFSRVF
jgi:hypothetical protein